MGNIYPSEASPTHQKEMHCIAETIGRNLNEQGYVGMFGLDFLINVAGKLVVVDLNPRHQGGDACREMALRTKGINLPI